MRDYASIIKGLPDSVPFVGPETQERQNKIKFDARLGANESVFGPSPLALEAMKKASYKSWMYGDPENYELKCAISNYHKVDLENIIVGEGIDSLLGYLARLFVEPSVNVVTSNGAYPTFNYHIAGYGGTLNYVAYKNDFEDIEGLLDKARTTKASIIYLANPDNPMGTWHSATDVENLIKSLPSTTLLCLDEAYSDFLSEKDLPSISIDNPNVIRLRTFSKAYGMAGARVGYGIGVSHLMKAFDRIRNHFGVNLIAQHGAIAALSDQAYLGSVKRKVEIAKKKISAIALANDLLPLQSGANFVAIDCKQDTKFAKQVLEGLLKKNIFVRMPFREPQSRCIRISVGTEDDLALLEKALPEVLNDLKLL